MKNHYYENFGPGEFYHVYNRGNAKEKIFMDADDYKFFLLRLKQNLFPEENDELRIQKLPDKSFSLIGYCLMPNHFHFLIKQNNQIPISKLMTKLCTSYSMYFNKKYNRVGHVFQNRFKHILIQNDEYLKWLSCYIHQNPKVGGIIQCLEDYRWSSFGQYIYGKGDISCENDIVLCHFKSSEEYKRYVNESYEIIKNNKGIEHLFLD